MKQITVEHNNSGSTDIIKENAKQLKQIFPEIFKEGKIDFEALHDLLGEYGDTAEERFCLNWAGKAQARREAQKRSTGTLRPCVEDSVDWDCTENIYLEGDNLEVLKLLQKSYHKQVKMIYIDPPYNTGKDFVYKDNYKDNMANYLELTGQDKAMSTKALSDSDGRYHSNWLNMMYPRLKLARNLLTDDGVIFISIDDNEVDNLRKICNEIFGEENFIAQIIWERAYSPINLMKHFSTSHDYILCYSKSITNCKCNGLKRSDEANLRYSNPDNDPRGNWKSSDLSVGPAIAEKIYEIITPSGRVVLPPNGYCWRYSKDRFSEAVADNRIWFGENGKNVPSIKRFMSEVKQTITPMTIWKYSEVGHSQSAAQYLKKLFDDRSYFDYPKPIDLVKRCIELYSDEESLILDFFSGSSTTAQAVMQINAENKNSRRKFIMVQLTELIDNKQALDDGYITICDIAKERIRRAGNSITKDINSQKQDGLFTEQTTKLDIGFKVFKLDSSNINAWDNSPDNLEAALNNSLFHIKENRTEDDLLYEILIKYGIELSAKVHKHLVAGKTVYEMGAGSLIVCLADNLTSEVAEGIVLLWKSVRPEGQNIPCRVVFKDSGFNGSDEVKSNTMLILKQHGIINVASV